MKTYIWIGALSLAAVLPACNAQTPDAATALNNLSALFGNVHADKAAAPALTLEEVERIALEQNPAIHVAAHKVEAAEAHVPLAGALDDLRDEGRVRGIARLAIGVLRRGVLARAVAIAGVLLVVAVRHGLVALLAVGVLVSGRGVVARAGLFHLGVRRGAGAVPALCVGAVLGVSVLLSVCRIVTEQ